MQKNVYLSFVSPRPLRHRGAWVGLQRDSYGFNPHSRDINSLLFLSLKFGRKWETECFNTTFSLPTLLYVGYYVPHFLPNSECVLSGGTQRRALPRHQSVEMKI